MRKSMRLEKKYETKYEVLIFFLIVGGKLTLPPDFFPHAIHSQAFMVIFPFEFKDIQCTKHFKRQLLTIKSQL